MSASWADVADSEKAASRAKPAYVPTHLRNMQSEPVATLPQNDRPGYGGQPSRWAPGGGVGGGGGYRNDIHEAKTFTCQTGVKVIVAYGGTPINQQLIAAYGLL
ncbi:unnamed protein product, partial [Brassica napus]